MEIGKISPTYRLFDFSINDYFMGSSKIVEINVNDANETEYLIEDKLTLPNKQVVEASRIVNNKGIDKLINFGENQWKLQKKEEVIKFDPIDFFLLQSIEIDKDILETKTFTQCKERKSVGYQFENEEYKFFNYIPENYTIERLSNDRCDNFELDQSNFPEDMLYENACYLVKREQDSNIYYPSICREHYKINEGYYELDKVVCTNYDYTKDIFFESSRSIVFIFSNKFDEDKYLHIYLGVFSFGWYLKFGFVLCDK